MNIEEIIKSSLENSEMPFDPKAWEAMSARLDQAMPVAGTPKTSWKWGWVATVAVVAGISAFFFIDKENRRVEKQQAGIVAPVKNKTEKSVADKENESIIITENKNQVESEVSIESEKALVNPTGTPVSAQDRFMKEPWNIAAATWTSPTPPEQEFTFETPKVNSRYCESEKVSIKNPNDYAITLVTESKNSYVIEANKNLSVELSEAGNYSFAYQKHGKSIQLDAFKVQAKPKADFFANEETLYENGLPVNSLKSTYPANEYNWLNAKGEILSKEQDPQIHLFTKGAHDITLKVEGSNGCTNQVTKSVRCEVNYNLLAMNGFNPESASAKNRTFIPYALLERNIPFEMEIIDPKTGQVIYTTKNADEPWDGVNRITNQMIPEGATYMWRVRIEKKEISEPKSVYQGSITRM